MPFERPRVRTDGPGGPNIKQGARIACLDCRTAKIRCSAPTDGKVPCSRCARHGKDCVFEKHRRGRKPGRVSSQPGNSSREATSPPSQHDASFKVKRQGEHATYRRDDSYHNSQTYQSSDDVYRSQSHLKYHNGASNGTISSSHDTGHSWSPSSSSHNAQFSSLHSSSSNMRSTSPPGTTYFDHQPSSHSRSHSSHSLLLASREAASREHYQHAYAPMHGHSPLLSNHGPPPSLSPRRQGSSNTPFGLQLGPITPSFGLPTGGLGSGLSPSGSLTSRLMSHGPLTTPLAMPRFNIVDHQLTPGGLIPASTLAPGGTPTKSWLDFASPKASYSPSHHSISTSIPAATSAVNPHAPYWPDGSVAYKRKPVGDYFSGALASTHGNSKEEDRDNRQSSYERQDVVKRRRIDEKAEEDESRSMRELQEEEREGEEALDKLADDEVGGGNVEDVLSTPLSLLAHASDAAAALKEGERRDSVGSKRIGAATMGLVSPPLPKLATPRRRWFDSDRLPYVAPRLPIVNSQFHTTLSPLLSHRQEREHLQIAPISRSTAMAPPFGPLPRRHAPDSITSIAVAPPSLGAIGRSRSYTTVESVNRSVSTFSPPRSKAIAEESRPVVTEVERRAEVLGEGVYVAGQSLDETESGRTLAPSTLDYDAWEYRDGRARTRKSFSAASGPGTSSISECSGKQSSISLQAESSSIKSPNSPSVAAVNEGSATQTANSTAVGQTNGDGEVALSLTEKEEAKAATPRRWQVLRRRATKAAETVEEDDDDRESDSEESVLLGASHQNFFSFSIFHSKMDNETDMDPVHQGIIELRELEKLFDIFFARINPLLNLLDPFLHSVNYVRNRSALLTTVIASHAARLSDNSRDAELAVILERYWRKHLLPEAMLGGYKSVELSQAFLILSLYHKPINRLTDDRSWQYLGFAIRMATEIGVNRATQPSESVREIEQVRRRVRNRARLWISLILADREQCFQTGRPWAIFEDDFISQSQLWHREDFALPEDTRLIGSLKLVRVVANYTDALKDIGSQSKLRQPALAESSNPFQWKEDIQALQYCLAKALAEVERWKDVWCGGALEEFSDGSLTQAVAQLLDRWQVGSKQRYFYCQLTLCTRVLQSIERIQGIEVATADAKGNVDRIKTIKEETEKHLQGLSFDAWQSCTGMIDSLLEESEHHDLSAAPNQTVVATVYAALAGLRLTRFNQGKEKEVKDGPDAEATVSRCKQLAKALIKAGSTPEHRNGAALSYGVYLKGIVTLWEENVVQPEASSARETSQSAKEEESMQVDDKKNQDVEVVKVATDHDVSFEGVKAAPTSPIIVMPLPTPSKEAPPSLQHHSVGDEVWGSSATHPETPLVGSLVASDPEAMDRMWDYLTTYPDPSSGFPLSLWQPHPAWTAPNTARPSNIASTQ